MQPSDSLQRASIPHPARHTHANSGASELQPSQLCSCRRCQTCRMRPQASPPHHFRPRITAAQDQPPIPRCPPLPKAASSPQPAAFPPLIPRNRDFVSSHRNPDAPPPRWYKCTRPSKGINYRSNKSKTPRSGPMHRVSPSDALENLA